MLRWITAISLFALVGCASWGNKDREKSELYLRMGISQLESQNYPQALRDLLKAEELDPRNAVVQNHLGLVYFFRERLDLAERHLQKALAIDPKYSEARNNLARVYLELNKLPEAEKEVRIVINDLTYHSPAKAFMNLGLIKFNQKQYAAARAAFSNALKTTPDDCLANTWLGRAFFEAEEYSQAAGALDRAIGFCQKDLYDEPHYFSALAYYRLGEKTKSTVRFEEVIKYYPTGKYREKAKGMLGLIRRGH